jgi:Phage-related minor tail protein
MAGEATIGALRVVLGLDSAKFEDSLKQSTSALGDFGKRMAEVASGIGLEKAVEKTFSAVVESITSAIDAADKLGKASQKFGIPVDQLSALSAAASLSDVSLDSLGSSLSRLSKNMILAQDSTGAQAAAFKALGISVTDSNGQLKNADQIVLEVADSFSKFRDGATKTALSLALFKSTDLIPFLNEGSDAIKSQTDAMRQYTDAIARISPEAAAFNDTMKNLAIAQQGTVASIIGESGLLRAMNDLAEALLGASKGSESLVEAFTGKLAAAIVEVRKALQDLSGFLESTARGFADIATAIEYFKKLDIESAMMNLDAAVGELGGNLKTQGIADSINSIGTAAGYVKGGFEALSKGLDDYIDHSKKAAAAPPVFTPSTNKEAEAFEQHLQKISLQTLDVSNKFIGQLAPGFLTSAGGMKLLNDQITITNDGLVKLGPQAQQLNDALIKLKGAQLTQSELTPWDTFQQKVAAARLELQKGAIDQETFNKAAVNASGQAAAAYGSYFSNLQSGFQAASEQNKAFAIAAKATAIASATISSYEAGVKALALFPPPFNYIAAAATVAAGLAMVASIIATPLAKGGSFKVPGGISGVDTKLIPLALAPGEQVDVTPAGGRGTRAREIILSGIGAKDLYSGEMLRSLVDALNGAQRDGYRLKVST